MVRIQSKTRSTPMPPFIPPMKAEPVDTLPRNKKNETTWGYEPKWYRLDARPWTCVPRLVLKGQINQSACP